MANGKANRSASAYLRVRADAGPRTRVRGSSNTHLWNWHPIDSVMEDGRLSTHPTHLPAPTTPNAKARAGRCGALGSAGTSFSRVTPGTHWPKCIGGPIHSASEAVPVAAPDCPLGQTPLQPTTTPSTHAHVGSRPRCKHEEPPTAWDSYACASTLRHVAVQPQKQIRPPRRRLVKGARWHAPLTTHAHVVKHVLADQKRPYHGMMNGCTVPRET